MMTPTPEWFEEICRALEDPAFYPHPASNVERRETHISAVFLTGLWVYKLKKPVNFGFLDFSDREARRRFCFQEVALNQRLSHGVYDGVVELRRDQTGRLSLRGPGEAVEYAVRMRQLPDEASLKALLRASKVSQKDMKSLGHHLAAFYERGARSVAIDHFGDPETIELNMEENFRQIQPFVGGLVPSEEWEFIRQVSRAFFRNWKSLFLRRIESGRIHDGHGDLRADHVYFHDGIQIIDCIEFNDRFRYGDVISDLAFLHMDLEHLGHADLSRALLAAYVEKARDPGLYGLIDFYAAYRAVVKVKVTCLRSTEMESAQEMELLQAVAQDYVGHAYRYAMQFSRPTLWVFCGLPASGKSSLAAQLSEALTLPLIQSDKVRKEAEGIDPADQHVVPYNQGIYRSEKRNLVYAHMLALAQDLLKTGSSVILDGSFSRRKWRAEARQLAEDLDTNMLFVECVSDENTLRSRLEERERAYGFSDARIMHLPDMIRDYEPLTDLTPETRLKLDTTRPLQELFTGMLSDSYDKKCAQIRPLL